MNATCIDYGTIFYRDPDQEWRVRCVACWRARQPERDHVQYLRERVRDLEQEIEALRQQTRIAPRIAEMLPRLVRLCHPDRHHGSRAATEVTQALLALRLEVRQ